MRLSGATFEFGCVSTDSMCEGDEKPHRTVTIARPFWMMTTEVTVGQFREFVAETGRRLPQQPNWSAASPCGECHVERGTRLLHMAAGA